MSNSLKLLAMFGLVAGLSACGGGQQEEEYVVVAPEPITMEQPMGKYK
ncbi:hypothetical protein [Litorisediminicola beolgyonensis]|uniref:Lipoprotein n=1 Tax=Litorisediminicola beolgyonensis TaxID=1173614 RepID=A0ABW3ZFJ0_9RHOB